MFVVSRVFKFLGVGRVAVHPSDRRARRLPDDAAGAVVRGDPLLKIADNSLDYSLGNTTKQALWLPTSREAKYKAKQAVDSFFVRAGDVLQAGVVYTGELTALSVSGFAAHQRGVRAGWLGVVARFAALAARPRPRRRQGGAVTGQL